MAFTSPTRLAYFYKPPADGSLEPVQKAAEVILTNGDQSFIERANVLPKQYVLGLQVSDRTPPWRNQAAWNPGDFAALPKTWFDGSRNTPENPTKWVRPLPEFADYLWEKVKTTQGSHFRGVFLDNIPIDRDVHDFLHRLHDRATEDDIPLFANLIGATSAIPVAPAGYLAHLDGYMEEGFAVDWKNGWISPEKWKAQIERVEFASERGKTSILVSQGHPENLERQAFAFASYLLVSGPNVSFRYTNYNSYAVEVPYANYGVKLGAPVGGRINRATGYRRIFQNGYVEVDPVLHTAKIKTGWRARREALLP